MPTEQKQPIRLTGKRLKEAILLLWRSDQGPRAAATATALLALMLVVNGLNVVNSYVGRDFMSAIENRDMRAFQHQAFIYALVFVGSAVMAALYRYMEELFGILWRQQLTWRLTESYLSERTYYRLGAQTEVPNPDQRITEDVRAFTTTTLSFTLLLLNGTVTAVSFSGVLWSISPLLFAVAVAYALGGTLFAIFVGKPLIDLNYNQLDMEANFRADLIHVKENSESIALAHREGRFKTRLKGRLDALARNYHRLIGINRNLGFFTNGYNYFIQLIPALFIAPMFMAGKVEFGVITQSTMAFATLLGAFSLIITQFQSISAFTAVTARLQMLTKAIDKAHATSPCDIVSEEAPDRVLYENVTLRSSDDSRVLVQALNLEIPRGARFLFAGKQDAPKVALFRATAGIWPCGTGRIVRPGLEDILFLPERPYLPPGTLRHILLRSGMEKVTSDTEIDTVLNKLGLGDTVKRIGGLDSSLDWDDVFSIGEQHLFSVARILLAGPAFVYLDRPESALPQAQVRAILDMFAAEGMGVAVFAKGTDMRSGFDTVITLGDEGKWELNADREELDKLTC